MLLNGNNFINTKLNSTSKLSSDLTTEKFDSPNTDRLNLKNAYSDLDFNNLNRNNYIYIKFNSNSKFNDQKYTKLIEF